VGANRMEMQNGNRVEIVRSTHFLTFRW